MEAQENQTPLHKELHHNPLNRRTTKDSGSVRYFSLKQNPDTKKNNGIWNIYIICVQYGIAGPQQCPNTIKMMAKTLQHVTF